MIRTGKRLLQMGCGEALNPRHGKVTKRSVSSGKSKISAGLLPLRTKSIRGFYGS